LEHSGAARYKSIVDCVILLLPASAHPFAKIATAMLVALVLLVHAGCTTAKPPALEEEPVTELAPSPPPPAEPEPEPQPVAVKPAPKPAKPPEVTKAPPADAIPTQPVPHVPDHLKIRIESNPAGAMIVVDGRPLGRTPVELQVDSANNGFFKAPMTIRARFVASDAASESISVDERLGPLERVPLALVFSREGVQRVIRQQ
jgi:outer membrane biosynthesis protein TonB